MTRHFVIIRYICVYLSLVLLLTLPVVAQDYYYTDKLFGKNFTFTPKETEIAIKFRDGLTENRMREIAGQHGLSLKTEGLEQLRYGIFSLPRGVALDRVRQEILESTSIVGVVPVFVYQEGYERYIDPEWLTVQFAANVSQAEAESLISELGTRVAIKHWTPGYYTITVPKGMTVFQAVRTFMALPQVKFSEPASYGFNDLLQDTYLNQHTARMFTPVSGSTG